MSSRVLTTWNPEDKDFWEKEGKAIATRNLWISIPALFLAFSVWMVWSVVVVNMQTIGFKYDSDKLFWLAALPGLTGATLRIFYSFMVPIFGGRKWTTISTASLLIPAVGIGLAQFREIGGVTAGIRREAGLVPRRLAEDADPDEAVVPCSCQ